MFSTIDAKVNRKDFDCGCLETPVDPAAQEAAVAGNKASFQTPCQPLSTIDAKVVASQLCCTPHLHTPMHNLSAITSIPNSLDSL
jgi:hypothetical protein